MYFLMTNDVEEHSIALNRLDDATAWRVYREGLPKLLDLYSKYDVQGTFYFTGTFAEKIPEAIELVMEYGHEIGCHGYSHEVERAFDVLSYEEQVEDLWRAKKAIESVAGRIEAFRAPAARINEHTVRALEASGFKTDSSVASQRFDGPFTFGGKNKLHWLFAPRMPYYVSYESPFRKGESNILEVPISAFVLAYVGSTMRVSPFLHKVIQYKLFNESKKTEKPINFVFHPIEIIEVNGIIETTRRATNFFSYVFRDVIRHNLKLRNLGDNALRLITDTIKHAKETGFEFVPIKTYHKNYPGKAN